MNRSQAPLPHAHVSLVTLGVSDIARSARFYESLGFARKVRGSGQEVAFFQAGACVISLYGWGALARDAGMEKPEPRPSFRGISLAWNCASEDEVDTVMSLAEQAGATMCSPAQRIFWGGYVGYFEDPDGHLWEVAYNPHFALADDGRLTLTD